MIFAGFFPASLHSWERPDAGDLEQLTIADYALLSVSWNVMF